MVSASLGFYRKLTVRCSLAMVESEKEVLVSIMFSKINGDGDSLTQSRAGHGWQLTEFD